MGIWDKLFGKGKARETGAAPAKSSAVVTPPQRRAQRLIAAGNEHSLALKPDGTVWAWGFNKHGQLGDGTTTLERYTAVQVQGLRRVVAIAAGDRHSLAVKADGTVWAWGWNQEGELGGGAWPRGSATPVQTKTLTHMIAVAAGRGRSLALKSDGTVWVWGEAIRERDDGTWCNSIIPVQVKGLMNIIAVAAGFSHFLALKTDGTVWAWGINSSFALGDGTRESRLVPLKVNGLTNVIAIAAGNSYSLAVKADGTVWAWGRNLFGVLGDGTKESRSSPVLVTAVPASGPAEEHQARNQ